VENTNLKILKKTEIKIMARTTPDKAELKRNIVNIKKFLQQQDCGMIDSGIELLGVWIKS